MQIENPSRRQFLKGAGALAIVGALSGVAGIATLGGMKKVAGAEKMNMPETDRQWVMVIDLRRCDGCKACTTACQKEHYLHPEQEWIKVYKLEGPSGQKYNLPKPCMQCEDAPCVRVCPVKATFKTSDGVTLVDANKCIGCRMCMAACPYASRYFNWKDSLPVPSTLAKPTPEFPVPQQKGTVGKCEFCLHDVRAGKLPACVRACEMRALWFGDKVADLAANPDEVVKLSTLINSNDATRLMEELNTGPRVYYIGGHGQEVNY